MISKKPRKCGFCLHAPSKKNLFLPVYFYLNENQLSVTVSSKIDSLSAYMYIYDNKFTFAGMEGIAVCDKLVG